MFELLLLSVVVSTGYLGWMVLWRLGPGQRLYGIMIVADLLLAILAFAARKIEGGNATGDTVGVISIGAAFCLIMLPPMLRDLGRRFMAADRLRLARLLAGLREHLQPGMGARPEVEIIETILAVRAGREQEVVDALRAHRDAIDNPQAKRLLDERIAMTYLYAQRWTDGVAHYELRIDPKSEGAGSPQVSVEMVRAYCENDQVEKAALLMERIEASQLASEPAFLGLVSRARMVFLAFVGRSGALDIMVGQGGALAHMPEAARCFWLGVSRANAGDLPGARSLFAKAVKLSGNDLRAKKLAEERLARLDNPELLGPHSHPPKVAELADRVAALASNSPSEARGSKSEKRRLPQLGSIPWRAMPVTVAFVVANLLVSLLVYLRYGNITDLGALIAVGANLKSATLAGEWWRMATSMFLHVGVAHLALNLYGLWILGRLVEQMHGSVRTLAIYGISGLLGALASTYLGGAGTAVGASGAVMGLMGAALAELGIYRSRYPRRWVRPLFGMLAILTLAQVAVGFFYPIVDQWGHVGGLLGGAAIGALLSPSALVLRRVRAMSGVGMAALALAFLIYAGILQATTSYTDTLRHYPKVTQRVGGLRLQVPDAWERISSHELYDPGIAALLHMQRLPIGAGLDATIAESIKALNLGGAQRAGFDTAKPAASSQMLLPAPWRGGELVVTADDGSGPQHYRLVVFGKLVEQEIWLGAYSHPSALTKAIQPVLAQVLLSMRADPELAGGREP